MLPRAPEEERAALQLAQQLGAAGAAVQLGLPAPGEMAHRRLTAVVVLPDARLVSDAYARACASVLGVPLVGPGWVGRRIEDGREEVRGSRAEGQRVGRRWTCSICGWHLPAGACHSPRPHA